ncbi:MAG: XdhC family protein [Actinomycetales bacterium]|nr:XdhC family protein [Actinomycetales bacterium]
MTAPDGLEVLLRAQELRRAGESFALATVVWRKAPSSGQPGSRAIVTEDGLVFGWIGGACAEPVLIRQAKQVLAEGTASLVWLGQPEDFSSMQVPEGVMTIPISCQSDGALQIFIEPVLAVPQVMVVGNSPMARTLVSLINDLGWEGELVEAGHFSAARVAPQTIVVVATQGHGDEDVLIEALQSEPCYLGLVASRRRGETVLSYLRGQGVSAEKLECLRVPIGLDLGHTGHREISVAILAELVQLRAAGELKTNSRRMLPLLEPADVVDPVCGMTVTANSANRPLEYQGTTYYFCAPGCRVAFQKDPAAFIQQEVQC